MARKDKKYDYLNRTDGDVQHSIDKQDGLIQEKKNTLENYAPENILRMLKFYIDDAISNRSNKSSSITLCEFINEHKKLMEGQISYAYLKDQLRALQFLKNFIGGSTLLTNIHPRDAEAFISQRLTSKVSVATVNKDIRF